MRTRIILLLILVITSTSPFFLYAQQETPYILNGSAAKESCNCYQLTPELNMQAGSVWNKNLIDLNQSFNYIFNVYLGCKDLEGADGIVFVLQPIGTSIGSTGQGIGFQNVYPSIGIPIDTYQNLDFRDPYFDHIGIYKNGDLVNGSSNTLAGPVSALADKDNIEDCQWHTFRIIWDAPNQLLSAEIDNVPRVKAKVNLLRDIFTGSPLVYWGFTSATGGKNNIQKFCTSLNPQFSIPDGTNSCAPADIPFKDASTSFGTIVNWWWNFGDGTTFSGQSPPSHNYPTPGYYLVKLNIEANNGCISDTFMHKITIGSIPSASFNTSPSVICANTESLLTDASTVEYGTINQWNWDFNKSNVWENYTIPDLVKTFPEGEMQIDHIVKTVEGCVSVPFSKSIDVTIKPATSISAQDVCYGDPVPFSASNISPEILIRQWYWLTGDGKMDSSSNLNYYYASGGVYNVGVYGVNYAGCSSDTATAIVTVYQSNAKAGNDTIVAFGQPLQLNGSGGEYYQWTPVNGLNNSTIPNPVAILDNDMNYVLKAFTSFGCPTYDTIRIKAYRGPEIYVPNAFSPDGNGVNDRFHPVAAGFQKILYFEVFNRLGQRVYDGHDVEQGWDGTFNGKPQPIGTYVWMIKGQDYLGQIHTEKGTVVLVR